MAEYWVKYVRRFDRLLEDALRLAIKSTLQNVYKSVHGDGKNTDINKFVFRSVLLLGVVS